MVKLNKLQIKITIVLCLFAVFIGVVYGVYLNTREEYVLEDIIVMEILGTEDYGYAKVSVNPEFYEDSGIDTDSFSYTVSKYNNLSNGEHIIVEVDERKLKKSGIRLNKYSLEYIIAGLTEGSEYDIFKDLIITYDKSDKKIILDNSECSEFVKENVIFNISYEKDKYEVGDKVVITGYVDMNAAADNRYDITNTRYEYVVK